MTFGPRLHLQPQLQRLLKPQQARPLEDRTPTILAASQCNESKKGGRAVDEKAEVCSWHQADELGSALIRPLLTQNDA